MNRRPIPRHEAVGTAAGRRIVPFRAFSTGVFVLLLMGIQARADILRPHGWLELDGKVTRVVDGNNFRLLDDAGTEHQIRFMYVETPELSQPWGFKAKKIVEKHLLGKTIHVIHRYFDGHGRILGRVYVGDEYINMWLVRQGLAWARPDAPEPFRKAMNEARAAKRGLWIAEHPVPPWFWRRGTRSYRPGLENQPYPPELPYSPSSNERALIGVQY